MLRIAIILMASLATCGGAFGGGVFGDSRGTSAGTVDEDDATYSLSRSVVTGIITTNGWGTIYPWQRKVFYAVGRYWVFYADDTDPVSQRYRSSTDGISWGAVIHVRETDTLATSGHRIGYYFDGTYIHYGYDDGNTGNGNLFYRRGLLNSDGTITWSADEQTVINTVDKGCVYMTVAVDSNGYPWIGCMLYSDPAYTAPYLGNVYKSSTNDGTWTTQAGFPRQLISNSAVFPVPVGAALTGGKMFYAFSSDDGTYGTPLYGRLWNGSSWDGQENITTISTAHTQFDVVAEGDAVHLVFEDVPNKRIYYRKRSSSGAWGGETELTTSPNLANWIPTISLLGPNHIRAYWASSSHVYYRDVINGSAAAIVDASDETTDGMTGNGLAFNVTSNYLSPLLVYVTKTVGTRNIIALLQVRQ